MKSNKVIRLSSRQSRLVALVGPTGSGKTSWAKFLSKKYNFKVISADSRQIYRGMDIGTAKDKSFKQELVDILDLDGQYSVAQFQKDATKLVEKFHKKNEIPIVVGGTGLYIEALLYGYEIPDLRKESLVLREKLEKLSEVELLLKLKEFDPVSAKNIDPKNKRRLIRALEVSILTGKAFSEQKSKKPIFDSLIIGIEIDRETLYAKVDARINQMIKDGLVEEVRKLISKYDKNLPSFNTIGYKELIEYIDGRNSLKEAIEKIKFNTHAYIRRQETWFRRDKNIKWVKTTGGAEKLIEEWLV